MIHEANVQIAAKEMGEWASNERKPYWRGLNPRVLSPVHYFYLRMIDVTVEEARDTKDGIPTDDAVLAVDWLIARKAEPLGDRLTYLCSIENCAAVLSVDVRRLRGNIRRYLRYQVIATAQADVARLYMLTSKPLDGDEDELFDALRVVPVLDQGNLFAMMETVH